MATRERDSVVKLSNYFSEQNQRNLWGSPRAKTFERNNIQDKRTKHDKDPLITAESWMVILMHLPASPKQRGKQHTLEHP